MTIEIPETEYEEVPYLNADVVKKHSTFTCVEPAPHMVTIKSGPRAGKSVLVITLATSAGKKYAWFSNDRSARFLVEKFGNDENKWIGKKIEIVVKEQVIQGEDREVIYAKGATAKKKDDKKK